MVVEVPSILEISAYIFFCQSCALGIFIEFADFKRWIERSNEYANTPSPILESLSLVVQGLLCVAIFIAADTYIPIRYIWSSDYGE